MRPGNREGLVSRSDPAEIERQRRGREVRCPRCLHRFETMRRFEMACPECGWGWEEPSHRTLVDTLRELPANLAGDLFLVVPVAAFATLVAAVVLAINRLGEGLWHSLELGAVLGGLLLITVALSRRRPR